MRSFRLSLVAPLLVASTLLLTGTRATADPTTTTSTVTTETTSTTSTTAPITTTAVPATTPTPSSTRPAPPQAAGGDEPVDGPIVLPPDLQAKMNAVHRTRPNDDTKLLEVVKAYASSAHMPLEQAMALGLGHFPVAGP